MLSASRCHETTQREMRSAADLFASIEQLPGTPVRPPTDGPGLARRKVRLDAPMTKPILAKSGALTNKCCNNRCVTLPFPHVAAYPPGRVHRAVPPNQTDKLPSHDGFRIIARKSGAQVRLYSRPGNDLTSRFPLIVETLARLRSRSCIIDGEAVACDENGVASFDFVRHQRANESIFLYGFDLIEQTGDDLRGDPLEVRKAALASIVAKASPGIRFNEHMEGDGPTVFAHARKLGLEGIVSKRKDSIYRSGRSPDWLKMKNANAPAVKREAEEDWSKERRR